MLQSMLTRHNWISIEIAETIETTALCLLQCYKNGSAEISSNWQTGFWESIADIRLLLTLQKVEIDNDSLDDDCSSEMSKWLLSNDMDANGFVSIVRLSSANPPQSVQLSRALGIALFCQADQLNSIDIDFICDGYTTSCSNNNSSGKRNSAGIIVQSVIGVYQHSTIDGASHGGELGQIHASLNGSSWIAATRAIGILKSIFCLHCYDAVLHNVSGVISSISGPENRKSFCDFLFKCVLQTFLCVPVIREEVLKFLCTVVFSLSSSLEKTASAKGRRLDNGSVVELSIQLLEILCCEYPMTVIEIGTFVQFCIGQLAQAGTDIIHRIIASLAWLCRHDKCRADDMFSGTIMVLQKLILPSAVTLRGIEALVALVDMAVIIEDQAHRNSCLQLSFHAFKFPLVFKKRYYDHVTKLLLAQLEGSLVHNMSSATLEILGEGFIHQLDFLFTKNSNSYGITFSPKQCYDDYVDAAGSISCVHENPYSLLLILYLIDTLRANSESSIAREFVQKLNADPQFFVHDVNCAKTSSRYVFGVLSAIAGGFDDFPVDSQTNTAARIGYTTGSAKSTVSICPETPVGSWIVSCGAALLALIRIVGMEAFRAPSDQQELNDMYIVLCSVIDVMVELARECNVFTTCTHSSFLRSCLCSKTPSIRTSFECEYVTKQLRQCAGLVHHRIAECSAAGTPISCLIATVSLAAAELHMVVQDQAASSLSDIVHFEMLNNAWNSLLEAYKLICVSSFDSTVAGLIRLHCGGEYVLPTRLHVNDNVSCDGCSESDSDSDLSSSDNVTDDKQCGAMEQRKRVSPLWKSFCINLCPFIRRKVWRGDAPEIQSAKSKARTRRDALDAGRYALLSCRYEIVSALTGVASELNKCYGSVNSRVIFWTMKERIECREYISNELVHIFDSGITERVALVRRC